MVQDWLIESPPLVLPEVSSDQHDWFAAAADALEARDDDRAAHYMLWAFVSVEIQLLDSLYELAIIGRDKLQADGKRGPKRSR